MYVDIFFDFVNNINKNKIDYIIDSAIVELDNSIKNDKNKAMKEVLFV